MLGSSSIWRKAQTWPKGYSPAKNRTRSHSRPVFLWWEFVSDSSPRRITDTGHRMPLGEDRVEWLRGSLMPRLVHKLCFAAIRLIPSRNDDGMFGSLLGRVNHHFPGDRWIIARKALVPRFESLCIMASVNEVDGELNTFRRESFPSSIRIVCFHGL